MLIEKREKILKPNYIGIIAGILAFISIALPWWTYTVSLGEISAEMSIYLYQIQSSLPTTITLEWYAWAALALIIIGGLLAIVGSVIATMGKKIIIVGGIIALLSIIIFAVGLMTDSQFSGLPGGNALFGSGTGYSYYLSYGFWIALVAAIIAFVAYAKHPAEAAAPPS